MSQDTPSEPEKRATLMEERKQYPLSTSYDYYELKIRELGVSEELLEYLEQVSSR